MRNFPVANIWTGPFTRMTTPPIPPPENMDKSYQKPNFLVRILFRFLFDK